MKVERINLKSSDELYSFPFHLLHASGSSNLKYLRIRNCSLPSLSTLASPITSLESLEMSMVYFPKKNFNLENLHCYFPNLQYLSINCCRQLPNMQKLCGLWSQLCYLKSLEIDGWAKDDFEICDANLTSFTYSGGAKNILLKRLNCLQCVDIHSQWSATNFAKFLSVLPENVPQLARLSIGSILGTGFQFPSSTFKCLKRLDLIINISANTDLRNLSSFLHVAPLLQHLTIKFRESIQNAAPKRWPEEWLEERLGLRQVHKRQRQSHQEQQVHHFHSHLKKVKIEKDTYFFGKNDVELVVILLKSVVSLETMILDSEYPNGAEDLLDETMILDSEYPNGAEDLLDLLVQYYPTVKFTA